MAKEEVKKEEIKEEDDRIVVDDPVVEEEESDSDEKINETDNGGSGKIKIVALFALLISVVCYLMFFSGGNKDDIVDNGAIIKSTDTGNVNRNNNFQNSVDSQLSNQNNLNANNKNDYNIQDIVPVIPDNEIKVPDIPVLNNDSKNLINKALEKENEKAFSKEEVDKLINNKLEGLEEQMILMKRNNELLSTQFKEKEKEWQKKIEDEKKEREKKERELKILTAVGGGSGNKTNSSGQKVNSDGSIFGDGSGSNTNGGNNGNSGNNGNGGNAGNSGNGQFNNSGSSSSGNNNKGGFNSTNVANGGSNDSKSNPFAAGNSLQEEERLAEIKKQEDEIKIAQRNRVLAERKGASMFKMQGGGGGDDTGPEQDSIIIMNKDLLVNIKDTTSQVVATKLPDLSRVVAQGKVIDAILESGITTDGAAQVRAIVTRDIYAEYGKNILIPKGSRVIGTFTTSVKAGVARVGITWNRIIRVDGLSLNITAEAGDRLGRGGVEGELDNKYLKRMGTTFLSSMLTVASAMAVEGITDSTGISKTTSGTSGDVTETSGKASDYAMIEATQDFMDEIQDITDGMAQEQPTIRIAQGTKIVIMVNQDLTLPIYKISK